MAYTPPPVPAQIPSLATTLASAFLEKGLTTAAVALAANGVIQTSQEAQIISLGTAVVAYAASCAWAYFKAKTHVNTVIAAANAGGSRDAPQAAQSPPWSPPAPAIPIPTK